eukprot:TRINITY_DN1957_c0_g1_i1.p1 TRINITY_DN1957_c0_g1~~TRINITY_DN1957_c0_g1_i1.p1  ORF type:complete len:1193 (+),score=590.80 TRINITY_DN1957_c0_g1_i1:75-3653(+)
MDPIQEMSAGLPISSIWDYMPSGKLVFGTFFVTLVTIPFVILFMAKRATNHLQAQVKAKAPRKFKRPKWTLDDPTQRKDVPLEMKDKGSIAAAVKRYADKKDDSDDSDDSQEDEDQMLTPEQILAKHQEIPREPHLGIFIGVDDPHPHKEGAKNSRCAADARDMSEAFQKLDYRTFVLHDHKSHKTISESGILPTRLNMAQLLRNLREGKYDETTRRKPNTAAWQNCTIYLSTKVRITTYSEKSETLEFLVRQQMEPEPVWIDLSELVNKVSDIPFRSLFVVLDCVHTGKDDVKWENGEDKLNPGEPIDMNTILHRTGVMSGIVNSQRCSVVGAARPSEMPKELPKELQTSSDAKANKVRNGPFVHFLLAGLKEVEKADPNAELWKNMGAGGAGAMGGGFGGMMPTVAPITAGDLNTCPFHCGDMTVDAIYRFMAKRMRLLCKDPTNDPAYHQGCIKMTMAVQRAIRPRDAPDTPTFAHECKREELMKEATTLLHGKERKHKTIALYGESGAGKSSLLAALAWNHPTLSNFTDGVYHFSLRSSLDDLAKNGTDFVADMQQKLAHSASGYEGTLTSRESGAKYLSRHLSHLKSLLLFDDVKDAADVKTLLESCGLDRATSDEKYPRECRAVVLLTTESKEVADACDVTINVPNLSEEENVKLLAATAGLLSKDDLPAQARDILKAYDNVPLFTTIIGCALRGATPEQWQKFSEDAAKAEKDQGLLMDAMISMMPEEASNCVKALRCIPENRAIPIPALMTFWNEAMGGSFDWNKLYSVLAQLMDCGAMSLTLEEDYAVLIHPKLARALRKGMSDEDCDAAVVKAYQTVNNIPDEALVNVDQVSVNQWVQVPWDGYFHTHGPEHLFRIAPKIVEKMFTDARWVLSQHDSCRARKLLSDFKKYGGDSKPLQVLGEALEEALPALLRHPWEVSPQLIARLRTSDEETVKAFVSDLPTTQGARPATPEDKHQLWLNPIWNGNIFHNNYSNESEALSVGFFEDNIVTGHKDGSVNFWSWKDGAKTKTLKGHEGGVHCVVPLEDGRLATGSKDEKEDRIRIWNLETGEGERLPMLDRDCKQAKTENSFPLKAILGRTSLDEGGYDDDMDMYGNRNIITDAVVLEHGDDNDEVNCHTFVGWDAHQLCASVTLGCKVHDARLVEREGRLYVCSVDEKGRLGVFMLMTNDIVDPPADDDESE